MSDGTVSNKFSRTWVNPLVHTINIRLKELQGRNTFLFFFLTFSFYQIINYTLNTNPPLFSSTEIRWVVTIKAVT